MTEQPRTSTSTNAATSDLGGAIGKPPLEALDLGALGVTGLADAAIACDIDDPDCEVPSADSLALGESPMSPDRGAKTTSQDS